jgi:MFS transporter, DHA1 family, inner membrane transport protein
MRHDDLVRPALLALAVSSFAIGTTEFVITGLLPEIAVDFRVGIPTAGLLVSGYALGVVVGAPAVTAAVVRLPRKPVLSGLLVLFVAGNLMSAFAPGFAMLLAGRVVAALCHGAFLGVGSVVAAELVTPDRKARAIAGMLTGLTVANVAGVPLGTLLGQQFGWRSTFVTIAGLGLLGMIGITVLVPPLAVPVGTGLWGELTAFRGGQLWLALAMTALGFGAVYAPFTYVAPLMTSVAGFAPTAVPWLLMLFGAGLVLGNLVGARAADRRLMTTIVVLLVLLTLVLLLFDRTAHARVPAALTLFLLGTIGFATVPAFTSRVLGAGGPSNTLASSAAVAAFNLGNATGAYLGGRVIAAGAGDAAPILVGAAMAGAALLVAVGSAVGQRWSAPSSTTSRPASGG